MIKNNLMLSWAQTAKGFQGIKLKLKNRVNMHFLVRLHLNAKFRIKKRSHFDNHLIVLAPIFVCELRV